jgi:hypothetical protein
MPIIQHMAAVTLNRTLVQNQCHIFPENELKFEQQFYFNKTL